MKVHELTSKRQRWPVLVVALILMLATLASTAHAQGTLFVQGDNVGIGTSTPSFKLDITGSDGTSTRVQVTDTTSTVAERTLFKLENNGFPRFVLKDSSTGAQWLMAVITGGDFAFNKVGSGSTEFRLAAGGNLQISGQMTATTYNTSSSRTFKEGFAPVDSRDVLARLTALPISEWAFKGDVVRHMGPMAEDFRQAFGLGNDNRHIGLMDASGVAFAAIQGLDKIVAEKSSEIEKLREDNRRLSERLEALERAVDRLSAGTSSSEAPSN